MDSSKDQLFLELGDIDYNLSSSKSNRFAGVPLSYPKKLDNSRNAEYFYSFMLVLTVAASFGFNIVR